MLPLTISAAALLLRHRSYRVEDRIYFRVAGGYGYRAIVSVNGSIILERLSVPWPISEPAGHWKWETQRLPFPSDGLPFYTFAWQSDKPDWLGFGHWGFGSPASPPGSNPPAAVGQMGYEMWCAPHWFFAVAGVVAFGCACAGDLLRKRRAARGFCRQCGYDLRATPDRCPECGTEPSSGSSMVFPHAS